MKNLAIAVSALAILIILVFIFTTKEKSSGDILIPTPTPLSSPQLEFVLPRVSTSSSARKLYPQAPAVLPKEQIDGKKVRIKTDRGDIVFELNEETPIASSNFIFLAGEKFYD
ncbi:peptidylprolyl isomerase, partial [Candidatus Curtissbacteria bacterium]|nr:peptidylprolyl isomerase [Candidatus Curtissbacteria bacterium]